LVRAASFAGQLAVIIGLAGHIDHGKTALVRALTGVNGDRLKEERTRGITIDLGFAFTARAARSPLGFIDVPGHERFVHTMLAGAAGIDYAILTVAADDGIKPQTLEHLAILDLLGVDLGVVVLTKADLASDERLDEVAHDVRAMISGTTLANARVLAVSAATGQGVDALRAHLEAASSLGSNRSQGTRFRLAIDRVFTLPGVGLVVTGTVYSGSVHVGDRVQISPSGLMARVRSLHAQNKAAEIAQAGDRCALNLAGPGVERAAVRRGDFVLDPDLHAPTDRIDARLRLLSSEKKPINQWFPVRLHHAAAEVGARIVLLGDKPIAPSDEADVQLVLDRPIAAAAIDRYIVRDVSAQRTLGGGVFLDLRAPARKRRTPERQAQRAALAIPDPVASFAALLTAPPFAADLAVFARDHAFTAARADELASTLDLIVLKAGESRSAFAQEQWRAFASEAVARVAAYHAENPDLQGVGREDLRLALQFRLPKRAFDAALQKMAQANELVLEGAFVRLRSHEIRLSAEDLADWERVAPLLGGTERFRPPRVRDIAAATGRLEANARQILKRAGRMGWADEIAHDHFFLRSTVREMVGIAADLATPPKHLGFSAAEFRDRTANGRKVAIQILEFFDRCGVTLRRGDLRRINPGRLNLFGVLAESCDDAGGGESSLVGRPDFKSVWGSEPVSGGFDSHSLPPTPPGASGLKPP
jgi:selenocysteine-specific elongation factor